VKLNHQLQEMMNTNVLSEFWIRWRSMFDTGSLSQSNFVDVRANEMVKRALIVQTGQTMIFVTSKFDRDSQEKLSCFM